MVFIPDERHLCHPFYVKTIKELKVIRIVASRMVGPGGLEPPTPALSTRCSNQLSYGPNVSSPPIGGADRDRTDDLLNANQALFQLSYGPIWSKY